MADFYLSDVCDQIVDCEHKSAPIDLTGECFAVGTPAMRGNIINFDEARRISRETYDLWTKRLCPQEGDLLLAREAPVGPVVRIPRGVRVAPGQRTVLLRPARDRADSRFLYYLLTSPKNLALLQVKAAGSTVPHLNVADVRTFPLTGFPALDKQRAIAEVLGALDDKIAANTKMIAIGEGLIDAHFERSIAGDSETATLATVAEFHNRLRVPLSSRERESRPGPIPYYGASGVFGWVDEALFDDRLVLVGEDGSVITEQRRPVTQYIWGPAWVNNHAHVLSGRGVSTEVLYVAIRRADVSTLVTGAVQPKISMGNLKRLEIRLPVADARQDLERSAAAWFATRRNLYAENATLAATRDALLPALMSGTLRVRDAIDLVEETAS
ncbi:hypothetical protein GCM10011331_06360 [Flavimobilis marinus]|uniref:Type I restriction enzyme, S subunit n=1 Tax=Flavimobilis marinus TaxID=285351 RepID=A0A1I2D1M1_9MICO|nr:restriction endonuclease subunit S [Flavimobilis marinus]GHG46372.1 hypothetical protein GCM10011331_06360 [Flavimobilis marinus]SFE74406.1 type I restriction enzyme, S subunit [Flavimobilis marinus]